MALQGGPQGHQQPQGMQQWQGAAVSGSQQMPQYYQQNMQAQQQGAPWGQNGQPQQGAFQQSLPMYDPGVQPGQGEPAWHSAPQQQQPQQGSQGWQGGPQGQYMGQGGPQQQSAAMPANVRSWVGQVTQLILPNYGIVDGNAFYVEPVVVGKVPAVGDKVACEAIPNTDGGMYEWRLLRVEMAQQPNVAQFPPPQAQQSRPFAIPHNRLPAGKARDPPAQTSPMRSPTYSASPAHQPSAVPSKPLEGLKQEGPSTAELAKYNQMAPPMTAYTADYALAKASAAMEGRWQQAQAPAAQQQQSEKRPLLFTSQSKQLDEEAQKRSMAAAQQLGSVFGDPGSIGARLMGKMGFGVAGQGLGKAGQGIAAPVEAVKLGQGQGLGFAPKERARSPERDRPARRRGPRDDRPRPKSPPLRRRPRSRSASRSRSPPGGRYRVDPPKFPPGERERGVAALSKRYRNLYIPSDFCHLSASWVEALPDWDPLPLAHHVGMKIVKAEKQTEKQAEARASEAPEEKKEEAAADEPASLVPASDASTPGKRWGARVVLMSGVNQRLLLNSSGKMFQHPLKKLQFLVGLRGRSELALIGGAWEPVDGADPGSLPHTLVATAARTFKAATGVDLSACAHWTEFAQVKYLRKNGSADDIEENVVVYLVDAHEVAVPDQDAKDILAKAASAATAEIEAKKALDAAEEEEKSAEANFELLGSQEVPPPPDAGDNLTITPSEMTVAALQEALSKRGLDTKWNPLNKKKELVDRLQEYVDAKRKEHAALDKDYRAFAEAKQALEAAKEKAKQAKEAVKSARAAVREALKTVSDPPAVEKVEIQPNKDFLGPKESFQVEVANLDTLLDYTEKDDREMTFEVLVFGELFKEMLQARFGCGILRTLEMLEKQDRQAKAKKAEERRAKKEAEAAAKAKAKASDDKAIEKGTEVSSKDAYKALPAGEAATEAAGEAEKKEAAAVEAPPGADAMDFGVEPAAAAPLGATAEALVSEPAEGNGDTVMAEAKELEVVPEAKEGVVANGDDSAATVPPSERGKEETSAEQAAAAATPEAAAPAAEAPVEAEETAAEPVEAKDEADKPESTAAARKSKEKQKEPEADSKQVSTRSGKEPKRDSKDKKEEKPSSSSKKKDEKAKEKERDKGRESTRDKGRSRDDKGRSKDEPPSKRARSDRERDSDSKRKSDSLKKGDSKAAEGLKKASEKSKAEEDKKADKKKESVDASKAASRKRTSSEATAADTKQVEKKAKTEKQPEIQAPAEAAKQPEAEERSATEPKMPASGMAAGVPAAGQQAMVPAAAARPSAAQPPPHIAAPVQALPPPEPRWAPQATPFALACRFFDRDLAGYIEADDLEEILVMVSDAIPRRKMQHLVDTVVKRSKMHYMDQHASLEAKDRELAALQRKLLALTKSEAELQKAVSTAEGEKLTLQQEKAALAESLSEAKQEAEAFAAKGRQTAEDVCRVLEDIQQAQRSLADGREKVVALQEEFKPFSAALSVTAEEP